MESHRDCGTKSGERSVASRGLAAAASSAEVDSGLAGSRHDKRACDSSHNLSSVASRNISKSPSDRSETRPC